MKTPDWLLEHLLYRDALMLIINKPSGIPVHKGSGGGENLEQYFDALRFGLPRLPALAHRLDRDTSGCLILGRHRQALAKLGKLFEKNKINKTYWAVVDGKPEHVQGIIDLPLAKKSERSNHWHMMVDETNGLPSLTEYKLLGTIRGKSWLELKPQTGRTHQLRVHCAAIGCPIIGDKIYGDAEDHQLHLHARSLNIPIYRNKGAIFATAPLPQHMKDTFESLGFEIKNENDN
ncbi:MAG: RluA family pseudouridine synthase [Rickettsiales bacterium]